MTKAKGSQIMALQYSQCRWLELMLKHFDIKYLLVDLKKTVVEVALLLWKFTLSIFCSGIYCPVVHATCTLLVHGHSDKQVYSAFTSRRNSLRQLEG